MSIDNKAAFACNVKLVKKSVRWTHLCDVNRNNDRFCTMGLIGRSSAMLEIFEQIRKVAQQDITVMLLGETGTGKEVIARIIHRTSPRKKNPFEAINCAAIPENLFESELFGHEKGSFTGALKTHQGVFEKAHMGTLFLDEIAEMHPNSQARLLRVIQERRFGRVGGSKPIDVDVRLISASNRNMDEMIATGLFRTDLYYRLMVYPIYLQPLRNRRDDIPLLCEYFIRQHTQATDDPVSIERSALDILMGHDWPGNVRELENTIQYALVSAEKGRVRTQNLPPKFAVSKTSENNDAFPYPSKRQEPAKEPGYTYPPAHQDENVPSMEEIEKQAITEALRVSGGNVSLAARYLGLGRTTVYRKMSAYGLNEVSLNNKGV
jgi:transcriptional regulator with PAS, ATPase and Fis domain